MSILLTLLRAHKILISFLFVIFSIQLVKASDHSSELEKIKEEIKSGQAQMKIKSVEDRAKRERVDYKPQAIKMAERFKKSIKNGRSVKKVNFSKDNWKYVTFKNNNDDQKKICMNFLKKDGSNTILIASESFKKLNTDEINNYINKNFDKLLSCKILRVTFVPKYPHHATIEIEYDKNGTIEKIGKTSYWE